MIEVKKYQSSVNMSFLIYSRSINTNEVNLKKAYLQIEYGYYKKRDKLWKIERCMLDWLEWG